MRSWNLILQVIHDLTSRDAGEQSNAIRERVNAARSMQTRRFQKGKIHFNAQMGAKELKRFCEVSGEGQRLLETAITKFGLSARAYHWILKVSRTIADLEGSKDIQSAHISEAIQYRRLDRRTF